MSVGGGASLVNGSPSSSEPPVYGYHCASGDSGVVPEGHMVAWEWVLEIEVRLLVDVDIPDFFHPHHSPYVSHPPIYPFTVYGYRCASR